MEQIAENTADSLTESVKEVNQFTQYFQGKMPGLMDLGIKLVIVLIAFFVCRKIIQLILKIFGRSFERAGMEAASAHFTLSIMKAIMYVMVMAVMATFLGVSGASVAALIGSMGVGVVLDLDQAVLVRDVGVAVLAAQRLGLDLGEGHLRRLHAVRARRVHEVAVHVDDVVGVLVDALDVPVLADEPEHLERRVQRGIDVGREGRALRRAEDVAALDSLAGRYVGLGVGGGNGVCHGCRLSVQFGLVWFCYSQIQSETLTT